MKNYAIAQWISLGAGLLYVVFINIFAVVSLNSDFFDILPNGYYGMVNSYILFSIIMIGSSLLMLGVAILVFVRYIQYLMRLKEACNASQNPKLLGHYKYEIRVLILSIIFPVVAIIALFTAFFPLTTNISLMIQPIYVTEPDMIQTMYGFMIGIIILILLLVVFAIVIFIFRILSVLRLDEWAEELQLQSPVSMTAIKEGTNLIKWGVIIAIIPFLSSFSTIVLLIGYTKAGNAIANTFAAQDIAIGSGPSFTSYTTPSTPTFGTTSMPNAGQTYTRSPPRTKPLGSNLCPFCGAPLPSEDAKFCGTCGNAVR